MKLLYVLALLPFVAFATDKHPPKQPPAPPPVSAKAEAAAQASAESVAMAVANNEGISQSVNIQDRAQAPSVSQGAVFIPECGVGGNAGGSSSGGSGFLGFAYVPAWCQDFKYAAWLLSVGDYEAACEVMAKSKVGKRAAKKGIRAPVCSGRTAKAESESPDSSQSVQPQTKADLSQYALRTEVQAVREACSDTANRVEKGCLSK